MTSHVHTLISLHISNISLNLGLWNERSSRKPVSTKILHGQAMTALNTCHLQLKSFKALCPYVLVLAAVQTGQDKWNSFLPFILAWPSLNLLKALRNKNPFLPSFPSFFLHFFLPSHLPSFLLSLFCSCLPQSS